MESGFSYGDIIVIGAIAAFILLRYRAMLGQPGGRDEETRTRSTTVTPAEYERVIQLPNARALSAAAEQKDPLGEYGALADRFIAMRNIDREFSPDEFLHGARTAYEMILEAFNKADRDTLKMLLSDTLYQQFDASLKEGEAEGRKAETTLVAIRNATISDAKLTGNVATLTVDFLSEQIHLVRDRDGAIIEGDASTEEQVEDRWVFTRTLTSADPSWKIIET